jgi:multisubunit Na+/H+ antiporter MnhG subunit
MVLPGIQALFGFQLISVFNQGFKDSLSATEQILHLFALLLIAAAAALVMAPAAYHRQAHHQVSNHFIKISNRYLATAMWPLAVGVCLDIYLISRMITESVSASLTVAFVTFAFYAWNWFIFPRVATHHSREGQQQNL